MRQSLVIAAVLGLAACAKPAPTVAPPTDAEALKIVEASEASFTSGDINKIMPFYADKAVVFDAGVMAPTDDRQMLTKWTQGYVGMAPADFTVANRHVQVLDPNVLVASGIASFTVRVGAQRQRVSTRFTDVYQRQADNVWKVVHEHMSLPPAGSPMP